MMATIYDIAKLAGVSSATVSKVFNNYTEVSPKTKEKVLRIAKEIGYVPNFTARSLKTNKSYLVGVLFSENVGIGLEHQFFSVVLESFRKEIGHYGYDTIFINNTLGDEKIGYLDHCKHRNVEGLFIITAEMADLDFKELMESNIKCVTTDMMFDGTPFVMSDNYAGGNLAVSYFIEKGHRKIAHLSGPLDTISALERNQGYCAGLKEHAIGLNEDYIAICSKYTAEEAYQVTKNMFEHMKAEDLPSALFTCADIMAIGAIQALQSLGLRVPEDVSVIGFDDIALARYTSPALTTIKQDKELIGKTVAETLAALINGGQVQIEKQRLPVSIVERDSVSKRKTD